MIFAIHNRLFIQRLILSTNQPKKLRQTGGLQGEARVEVKIFVVADVTSGGQSILAKKNVEREQVGEHARREKCRERNSLIMLMSLYGKNLMLIAHI